VSCAFRGAISHHAIAPANRTPPATYPVVAIVALVAASSRFDRASMHTCAFGLEEQPPAAKPSLSSSPRWPVETTPITIPNPILGGGASVSAGGASASASALVAAGLAAMADVTLGNIFFIAAGPELLAGAVGSARVDPKTMKAQGSEGAYFSIAARTGLAFGSMTPKQRRAFTFGLDFRVILTPFDPVIVPMLGLGYDQF